GATLGAALAGQVEQARAERQEHAAVAVDRAAEQRLEQKLQQSRDQLGALVRAGVLQEAKELAEADAMGLARALQADLERLPADDGPRVLAALVREGARNGLDP